MQFELLFVGQILCGLSQPFFLVAPAMLATQWFEDPKRRLAITIGGAANAIGMIVGLLMPSIFVTSPTQDDDTTKNEVFLSLVVQAGLCFVLMVLTIFSFQDKPENPPSSNALVKRKEELLPTIRTLLTDIEFIKISISFGMFCSNIIVLFEICDEVVDPFGYDSDDAALFGAMNVAAGIASSFIYGYFLKKSKMYKCANLTIGLSTMLSLLVFMFSLYSTKIWLVAITYAIFGFCCFPTIILTYAYASELTFPIKESTSSGMFILFSQLIGIGLTYLLTWLKDV